MSFLGRPRAENLVAALDLDEALAAFPLLLAAGRHPHPRRLGGVVEGGTDRGGAPATVDRQLAAVAAHASARTTASRLKSSTALPASAA